MPAEVPPPKVREVIDGFAERLLALADGGPVPDEWMLYLRERLALKPRPRGRPQNMDCLEVVAYELERRGVEGLTGREKQRISGMYGVTTRTITNMQRIVRDYFQKDDKDDAPLSDEQREAVAQGIAHAMGKRMKLKDAEAWKRRMAAMGRALGNK